MFIANRLGWPEATKEQKDKAKQIRKAKRKAKALIKISGGLVDYR